MRPVIILVLASLAILGPPGQAAPPPSGEVVLWQGDQVILADAKRIVRIDRWTSVKTTLRAPADTLWTTYGENRCWALESVHKGRAGEGAGRGEIGVDGPPVYQRVWVSSDFKHWEAFGRLEGTNDAGAQVIVPLADGALFVAKRLGLHRSGDGYSPMYLVKPTPSGVLQACGNVELDCGPMYAPRPEASGDRSDSGNLVYNRKYQVAKNLLFELPSTLFQHGGGFVLGSAQMGVYWAFDPRGRLKRRIQVFDRMTPDDFARIFEFERAVVHAQMAPDGALLIGARTEAAVWFNQRFYPSGPALVEGTPGTPEGRALNEARSKELNPDIEWYRLDPEAGTLEPAVPPFGTPTSVQDLPPDCTYWFGFEWDDTIRYQGGAGPRGEGGCGTPAIPPRLSPAAPG